MTKAEIKFYRDEGVMLDRLYKERMDEWQKLTDMYSLKFKEQIRDLDRKDYVRVSRFYPLVRQIIASIAFNYPKMFFSVEEDGGEDVDEVLERASTSLFNLMDVKPHVHQAIFDALFCGVGWLRLDYNPPGDDMIPPYVTNDAMHEDLTAVNRIAPGFVHLDPLCPPHKLGHARYIREKMWVPLKQLKEDPKIKHKNEIKATAIEKKQDIGFGDPGLEGEEGSEERAKKLAIENGDFVLVERWHNRMDKKMVMFADGVREPIMEIEHPFAKKVFPQVIDALGFPMFEEDGITPVLDIESGESAPGWLVENGFAFIPVKFDLHPDSFYPLGHLKYVEDIQEGIVESLSRQATLLKRTARQGLVNNAEALENTDVLERLRRGVDGEWHEVEDVNNFKELVYGDIPSDQTRYEDRLRMYEEEITRVTDLVESGATPRTATEASLIATQISVNREWMEATVSKVYEDVTRNCFQIMGDPRYTPENFLVNFSPDGQAIARRAMSSMDFLWEFRIEAAAGSTQPLFEQIQQDKFLKFYDRAAQRPSFDQLELDKMLASSAEVDVDKLIQSGEDPNEVRTAQLENDRIISQLQDPGVLPTQDHGAHLSQGGHGGYQQHPSYQQLVQAAQQVNGQNVPINPQAAQMVQQIDALMQQHMQAHAQAQAQQVQGPAPAATPGGGGGDSIQSTVRGNAQNVANTLSADAQQATDGA